MRRSGHFLTPAEAAGIIGVDEDRVRDFQSRGIMPDPIPDDFLDAFIAFRVRMELAHTRKARLEAASVLTAGDADAEG